MNKAFEAVMQISKDTVKLRLDVDYAYPSRQKSFFCTILGIRGGKSYLENSKIIARMINESNKKVKAYWFFTPTTIPDKELLELLNEEKHEVALHVITKPWQELKHLERVTDRRINYYTVHGTQRLFARWMWGRRLTEARIEVPADFPLTSFYLFPTESIDVSGYKLPSEQVLQKAEEFIARGYILHSHPEWLFRRGTINKRGPFYSVLKKILDVDEDLDELVIRKKVFFKKGRKIDVEEYKQDFIPQTAFLAKLAERGTDIFTFIERTWVSSIPKPEASWIKTEDNIALQRITTFADWLALVGKKTRNIIRKAEKSGVRTEIVLPTQKLAEDILRIYNETPVRQGRAFPHFGITLEQVKRIVLSAGEDSFIGAFIDDEFVGFVQLGYGDKTGIIQQILSLQQQSDKAVNNALIAKVVQVCIFRNVEWLMYGRMGNHPSLDRFKENNGFTKFTFPRFYIALSKRGRFAIALGIHRDLKDSLPTAVKSPLFPIFSWISRNKQRLKLWLRSRANVGFRT